MSERPENVLLIMSDEHRPDALGCTGHRIVETPTLDALATEGMRFTNAYCPSPLCAPCRASFTTGQYVHEIGAWDNAASYDGEPESWGFHIQDHGVDVTTVGKLDFQPGVQGFPEQLESSFRDSPDVNGLYRDPPVVREDARERITEARPTENSGPHEAGDERRVARAVEWLEDREDDGWLLSVNLVLPHFPLTAEQPYYDHYANVDDLPDDYPAADDHPILEELRNHFDGRGLDEETLHRTRRAYYALCTRLDDLVERLLNTLKSEGFVDDTLVIYTSDHGEPLGDHETWWKCSMYDQSVGIPLIARGPGVESATVDAPVSLLDLVPTMADALEVPHDSAWRGRSQWPVLRGICPPNEDRAVFSEYHAHGVSRGMFMLRQGRYKYVHYPDNPDQLFDLECDPEEVENLADDPVYAPVRDRLESRLRERVDPSPDVIDERARADQKRRREQPVETWWGNE
ncbi:sulfatase-like hydrolase/transferase [Halomontanus rarus]|uniref:sulfatase-like hydrolase/transferase n=1 Tax=Halomontanus rarus TaxID=3034020 RepID=UPI0023E8853F|nr:sulfatase-like hydrolase/transferase [Halovivax sp. TS33]